MSDPGIQVQKPRAFGPLNENVRKAVVRHITRACEVSESQARDSIPSQVTHWGTLSYLDGGDTIYGSNMHAKSRRFTRDATFVKYMYLFDKNERFKNRPVILERRPVYGQLHRVVEFKADFGAQGFCNTHTVAIICPVKLNEHYTDGLGTPYCKINVFASIIAVDLDDVSCLMARVPDCGRWALYEQPYAMGLDSSEDPEET
ncbi:hypothetical protein AAF712_010868 [Marasmius tenuissimus]|uniref:Uncharacterized protein n=1 Tax=Marasmius tenuissimus TaxID=585030 RepID=A0ABR2ZNC7_9AGAR